MPPDRGRVLGAVLAGGASSRFGSDKALAMLGGRTLLAAACGLLAGFADEVVVVGRGEVSDRPAPGLGPLGGIAGALGHARANGFASVMTIACDMPEVPEELLAALLRRAPAFCADAPVLGHWPVELAAGLVERLTASTTSPRPCAGVQGSANAPADAPAERWAPAQGRGDEGESKNAALSVRRWASDIGALPIASPVPLRNVNTPADLESA